MLTACGNGNRSVVPDKMATVVEPEQQASSEPAEQPKETVDSFWDQNTVGFDSVLKLIFFKMAIISQRH